MCDNRDVFAPKFQITPALTKSLMEIEAIRQAVIELPFDVEMLRSLRETAKLLTTHHSTQIEGNRLTQAQVAAAISGARFPGRERDEVEVRNYYNALENIELLAEQTGGIAETDVQHIHGMAFHGQSTPTSYRDGQNVIRDGASGSIVYLPPQAPDVPVLMQTWWTGSMETWSPTSFRHLSLHHLLTTSTPQCIPTTMATAARPAC